MGSYAAILILLGNASHHLLLSYLFIHSPTQRLRILNSIAGDVLPTGRISHSYVHPVTLQVWRNTSPQQLEMRGLNHNSSLGCRGGDMDVVGDVLEGVAEICMLVRKQCISNAG